MGHALGRGVGVGGGSVRGGGLGWEGDRKGRGVGVGGGSVRGRGWDVGGQ